MYSKEQLLNELEVIMSGTENPVSPGMSVINAWEAAKKQHLFPLFGDKLVIEKEVVFKMSLEEICSNIKAEQLWRQIKRAIHPEYLSGNHYSNFNRDLDDSLFSLIQECTDSWQLAKGVIESNYNLETPIIGTRITKIQKGTKITKVLRMLIPDKVELERILTKYSQFFNQKEIHGTLCLSIHPSDYITASTNLCKWRSCFNLYDGEYKASLGGLIGSSLTMIAYLKSDVDMVYQGIHYSNKKWRTYVTIDENNKYFHIGKHYPYANSDLEEELVKMVSKLMDGDYEIVYENKNIDTYTPDGFYNDGVESFYLRKDIEDKSNYEADIYVADELLCLSCGCGYDGENTGNLYCFDCYEDYYAVCDCCGGYITQSDYADGEYSYTDDTGSYYCSCCQGDLYYCDRCGTVTETEMEPVQVECRSGSTYDAYYCDCCIEAKNPKGERTEDGECLLIRF